MIKEIQSTSIISSLSSKLAPATRWALTAAVSSCLALIRQHLKSDMPIEVIGILFVAIVFDPWLASLTGLTLVLVLGFLLDKNYIYLLIFYIVQGLYWGYIVRLGAIRIWGPCSARCKIKRWAAFAGLFVVGSAIIELGIKEALNELVFREGGLIYYREGLFEFWQDYIYNGKLLLLVFHRISYSYFLEIGAMILTSYLIYRFMPLSNKYLKASTQLDADDLRVEQNSIVLYVFGFSASLFLLYLIEKVDQDNFKLVDLIHTASFWAIFFIVLGTVAYVVGTKERAQSYFKSTSVIVVPPLLMVWMIFRIQSQINLRTSYKLKALMETADASYGSINHLISTQSYQQMWLTALITTSYLIGSFIIILIIFKWNNDLKNAKDELESQVVERTKSLKRAQEELVENEKLVSIGRLSAEVAHEVNNPLYGVLNYVEILSSKIAANHEWEKYVFRIRSGLYYITAILKQLRGISDTSGPTFCRIDIVKLIDESLLLMEYKLKSKNIDVRRGYERPEIIIDGDPQQLQQVFINIMHNAIQAMSGAGNFSIEVAISKDATSKDACFKDAMAEIRFRDEGKGIPEAELGRIFTPFFTTKKPEEGMGLGLTICEKIVKNHQGTIDVSSSVGKGTVFFVRLPIRQSHK